MAVEADKLVAVGLSHHTAPVEVRERLSHDPEAARELLQRLKHDGIADEALLLSTCNRMELYTVPRVLPRIREYLPPAPGLDRHLYWLKGREAVRHIFRVASSLDSLVVGEPQILGQVKDAVRLAEEAGSLGRMLGPLTQRTMSVAKRVRNETDVGRNRVGIGNAGVDLALQVFGGLEGKRAMLLGVGEMGRQVAQALLGAGLEELIVANRTYDRAVELANAHGGTAVTWERVEDYLPRADIVLAATGARLPVLTAAMVKRALRERRYRTLFLVDLSVPRNIDPGVDELEDAYLFNVDDLSRVVETGREARAAAAAAADRLVDEEADKFVASLADLDISLEIGRIARQIEALRQAEVERSRKLVRSLDDSQIEALDAMTRSLVKKVLHGPLNQLRQAARQGDAARVQALLELWDGEDPGPPVRKRRAQASPDSEPASSAVAAEPEPPAAEAGSPPSSPGATRR